MSTVFLSTSEISLIAPIATANNTAPNANIKENTANAPATLINGKKLSSENLFATVLITVSAESQLLAPSTEINFISPISITNNKRPNPNAKENTANAAPAKAPKK